MAYNAVPTVATSDSWTASQHNTYIKDNFAAVWVGTTAGDLDYYTSGTAKARLGIGGQGSLLRSTGSAPAWLGLGAQGAILRSNGSNPSWLDIGGQGSLLRSTGSEPAWVSIGAQGSILRSNGTNPTWLPLGAANTFLSSNGTNPVWAVAKGLHTIGNVVFNPDGQTFNGSAGTFANITGASFNLTLTVTCTIVVFAVVVGYNPTGGNSFAVRATINGVEDPSSVFPFNGAEARNEALPYIHYATGVTAGTRAVVLQCENSTTTNTVVRGRMIALAFAE